MTGRAAYLLPIAVASAIGVPYVASDRPEPESAQISKPIGPSLSGSYPPTVNSPLAGYPYGPSVPYGTNRMVGPTAGQIIAATPWTPVTGEIQSPTTVPHVAPGYRPMVVPFSNGAPGVEARLAQSSANTRGDLGTLFRFDLTPQWIISNWPRVSSEVSEPPLSGLRTAVVSGTSLHDIAGSMTYYFDSSQQMQRLIFDGTTGEPAAVVQLLTTQFKMTAEPTINGMCYLAKRGEQAYGMLRIRYLPLVSNNQPHRRYGLLIELNRPSETAALSPAHAQMLTDERKMLEPREIQPKVSN